MSNPISSFRPTSPPRREPSPPKDYRNMTCSELNQEQARQEAIIQAAKDKRQQIKATTGKDAFIPYESGL